MATIMFPVWFAMSVLQAIWEPQVQAEPAKPIRGVKARADAEYAQAVRERSPRRRNHGVKAMLKSWASGDISTNCMWTLCHSIVTEDRSDCGRGMSRLAALATRTSGSERNCCKKLFDLLAETALGKMARPVPHRKGERTITHHLRPTDLVRLIHSQNRSKFGQIFGADKATLKWF